MIEVLFIGTGPSLPLPDRGNTAFVVRSAHSAFLVECGPTVQVGAQNMGLDLDLVPYLFISHCHGDHMLAFPMIVLGRMVAAQMMRHPAPLGVFCPAGAMDILYRLTFDVYPEVRETLKTIRWYPLPEREISVVELEPDVRLTAAPVGGPPGTPTLGLRLDFQEGVSVAYSSDTAPCEEVPQLAQGCDLLVHEAYFSTILTPDVPSRYYHSNGRSAGIAARQAGCRMLALVHLGPCSYGHEDVVAREAGESFAGQVFVPFDRDSVRLNGTDIQIVRARPPQP